MHNLNTLEVYILAKQFRKEVTVLANGFPKDEKYLLTAQIKDSARSITANIAEGYGRYYYQDSIRFYRVSRGSLMETYDHLSSALDENYITEIVFLELKNKQEFLLEKLNGYIAYVKRRKSEEDT
jgi:four helix bundle protein